MCFPMEITEKLKATLKKFGPKSFDTTNYAYSMANGFLYFRFVFCKTDIYCYGIIISMICASDRNVNVANECGKRKCGKTRYYSFFLNKKNA